MRRAPGLLDGALAAGAVLAVLGMGHAAPDPESRRLFVVACGVLAACALGLYRRDRLRAAHVAALGLGLRLLVLGLPLTLSDDAYRYVWDGLVQARGENPYAYRPSDPALAALHDDALFEAINSPDYYTVYPPLSQAVFRAAGEAYERHGWRGAYFVLKAVFALAEAAALLLLCRLARPRLALLYACAPLAVIETAGQAHTESLAALALVAAVYADRKGRGGAAAVAVALAGLVKLFPFLFLPFLWPRYRWRAVWPAALVTAALCVPYAHPDALAHVRESLDLYVRLFEFNAGPYLTLKALGAALTGADVSKQLGPLLRFAFLVSLPFVYRISARDRWPVERGALVLYGFYFALATTIHPWYLVPLLALLPLAGRPGWAWHALALGSLGTYTYYHGVPMHWLPVAGWLAWVLLLVWETRGAWLPVALRVRARSKVRRMAPALPLSVRGLRVLDLGAGEGYVGERFARRGADVTLADVADFHRVPLPFVLLGERARLPFADGAFDLVVLVYVLHHAADADAVLAEACRVGRRVIVLESVFETERERRTLESLDRLANGLRGGGMNEAPLRFRRAEVWGEAVREAAGVPATVRRTGRWPHRQALIYT